MDKPKATRIAKTPNPRKWAKLQSTIAFRRLLLSVLRGILVELRKGNAGR